MRISWKEGVDILQLRERTILTTIFICCLSSLGYAADNYEVPRTEYGRPDFQVLGELDLVRRLKDMMVCR